MATKKSVEVLEVKPVELATVTIRINGTSELIVHRWSEKAKKEMLEAMQKNKAKEMGTNKTKKREDKRPYREFIDSLYWISERPVADTDEKLETLFSKIVESGTGRWGFPAVAFKAAAISAAYRKHWVPDKMGLRAAFYIEPDFGDLVEIKGCAPVPREDAVRVGISGTDLRYRGSFLSWYADLKIVYDINGDFSVQDIVNYLNAGGFACGVGEWRPEKDGAAGMFQVLPTK